MDAADAGRENILQTYEGLALAVPGTNVLRRTGFTLVRGPNDVSFCNYALGFQLSTEELEPAMDELVNHAKSEPEFTLFSLTGDLPEDTESVWKRRGFRCVNHLLQLKSSQSPNAEAIQLTEATTDRQRNAMCEFLIGVFFEFTRSKTQVRLTTSMQRSPHRFFSMSEDGRIVAGMMLVESPNATGLYSLAVNPSHRSRGLGRSMIRAARDIADARGVQLVLQCAPHLVPWYESCGFETFGSARTFLYRPRPSML